MKRRLTLKIVSIAAVLGILAMTGYGFAYDGYGQGHHRGGYGMNGSEDCPAWGNGPGQGRWGNLSQEDAQKFQEKRDAFFKATRGLRDGLYQKGLELRSELAKAEPDVNRASGIQSEISKMRSELDQKRLAHRIEMRKLFPDAGFGYGRGQKGMRGAYGMGRGNAGPGACWR